MPGPSTTERVRKFELPLSDKCVVVILFDGEDPDASCFRNLREFIELVETALIGRAKAPVKQKQSRPDLPPCTKHPGTERVEKNRRCPDCMREHALKMVAARKSRGGLKEAS